MVRRQNLLYMDTVTGFVAIIDPGYLIYSVDLEICLYLIFA